MRWILEHLNLVIVIAGAVAYWLNQRAREKAGEQADYDDDGVPEARQQPPPVFEDTELAEASRKIREEIQRKIAERRRAGEGYTEPVRPAAAPLQTPPSLARTEREVRPVFDEPPPLVREVVTTPQNASLGDSRRMAEMLEQQAALAERLKQVEQMRIAASRRAAYEKATQDTMVTARRGARQAMLDDLRDPAALRRAFIAREILGPPVGLR